MLESSCVAKVHVWPDSESSIQVELHWELPISCKLFSDALCRLVVLLSQLQVAHRLNRCVQAFFLHKMWATHGLTNSASIRCKMLEVHTV